MRLPRLIRNSLLLLTLLFTAQKICAQLAPADDFFNSGAQFYISNNIPAALERVESGLKFYPGDEKLKKLEELLKQQQQQQSQQQQDQKDQQNQSQQQKSQGQKNQQNQSSAPKDSQDEQKQDEQKRADQKKTEAQKPTEPQKSDADKQKGEENSDKQDKPDSEQRTGELGQMTPEEAKRLLDAQKGNEQLLQLKPADKPQENQKPVKDW